jgi:uncharacterized protein YjbI with pentapeptide repeats
MLWHLEEAGALSPDDKLRRHAGRLAADLAACDLRRVDVVARRTEVGKLLAEISAALRSGMNGREYRRADLAGADFRKADLRGADLRGALLVGARLTGAALDRADLLGADLRGADLSGADLRTAMFLTQPQLGAADGTVQTGLPARLHAPDHWQ